MLDKNVAKLILFSVILLSTKVFGVGTGIGAVADNVMQPVVVFSDFIFSGCIILGGSFLFASIVKYVEHKRSPLMVPISTVIFLLIAGIVLILLPFLSYVYTYGLPFSLFD